jgi:cysteine desulfurase
MQKQTEFYLDHNATTPVRPQVWDSIAEGAAKFWANPSSTHGPGRRARVALEDARDALASLLGVDSKGLLWTSGGTEADNWAILALHTLFGGGHVISTQLEHPAVGESLDQLEKWGWRITRLRPDSQGRLAVEQVLEALEPETRLVSVMWANNEVGTVQDMVALGTALKTKRPDVLFHSDAVQALGRVVVDPLRAKVDLLSLSGHKLGALKGCGALWVRPGALRQAIPEHDLSWEWSKLQFGGSQERSLRGGTENTIGILAMGAAAKILFGSQDAEIALQKQERDAFEKTLKELCPWVQIQASEAERLPNTSSVTFVGLEADLMLMGLDLQGIYCSTGSACSSGSNKTSPVLAALGLDKKHAKATLRFSMGWDVQPGMGQAVAQKVAAIALQQLEALS